MNSDDGSDDVGLARPKGEVKTYRISSLPPLSDDVWKLQLFLYGLNWLSRDLWPWGTGSIPPGYVPVPNQGVLEHDGYVLDRPPEPDASMGPLLRAAVSAAANPSNSWVTVGRIADEVQYPPGVYESPIPHSASNQFGKKGRGLFTAERVKLWRTGYFPVTVPGIFPDREDYEGWTALFSPPVEGHARDRLGQISFWLHWGLPTMSDGSVGWGIADEVWDALESRLASSQSSARRLRPLPRKSPWAFHHEELKAIMTAVGPGLIFSKTRASVLTLTAPCVTCPSYHGLVGRTGHAAADHRRSAPDGRSAAGQSLPHFTTQPIAVLFPLRG